MEDIHEFEKSLKEELLTKYRNAYLSFYELDKNFDKSRIDSYAEKCLASFLKLEGINRLFKSQEICDGVNLSPYLEKIRHKEEQFCLLLAIENDRVVDERIFCSENTTVILSEDYISNGAFKLFKEWNEKKYKVLNYHYHPMRLAARPDNYEIKSFSLDPINPNVRKALAENGLLDFRFYDWGVVTDFDFYSEREEKQSKALYEEAEREEKELRKLL